MRTNLKVFRVKAGLSQEAMAEKIGCTRATYSSIENGKRNGRQTFWKDLQKAFGLPDAEIWPLMDNSNE